MEFISSRDQLGDFENLHVTTRENTKVTVSKSIILSTGQPVAVKTYSPGQIQNYLSEIQFLDYLSGRHEGFLPYLGHYSSNNSVSIVQGLGNITLKNFVGQMRIGKINYSEAQCCFIVDCLIEVFAWLESKKIYHRDIKPENILISEDLKPKIIDFNISIRVLELETKESVCLYDVMGTPTYYSPELASIQMKNGKGLFNLRLSEVYCLGICILFLLIKPEWNKPHLQNEDFIRTNLNLVTNALYKELLQMMLKKNPQKRRTFTELLDFLIAAKEVSLPSTYKFPFNKMNVQQIGPGIESFSCYINGQLCSGQTYKQLNLHQGQYLAHRLIDLKKFSHSAGVLFIREKPASMTIFQVLYTSNMKSVILERKRAGLNFTFVNCCSYLRTIVELLVQCLELGFSHNDISASGCFFDGEGNLKVGGFNLPKNERLDNCFEESQYTPPELKKGFDGEYDNEKADVYALGVLFYEMITSGLVQVKDCDLQGILPDVLKKAPMAGQGLLKDMLNSSPSERISLKALLSLL